MYSVVETAEELTSNLIPVVVLQVGRKAPKRKPGAEPRPDGTYPQWVITDPEEAEAAFRDPANIGIMLGSDKNSPLVSVGLDLYKDKSVADRVKELGVTSEANVWIERSGRGGLNIIYADPGVTLQRDTTQAGATLDLMTRGYVLVAPSDTSAEPQGGGPYTWIAGHSPWDIPLTDLEQPPPQFIAWWQGLPQAKRAGINAQSNLSGSSANTAGGAPEMPSCFQGPIPEGQRNVELTARAGYLHRMLPNDALVRDLIHGINQRNCTPPLSTGEVETILLSILRREGASHFRGVQPARLEPVR